MCNAQAGLSTQAVRLQIDGLNDIVAELNVYLRMTMKWQGRQEALAA
jgi:hypothetical protein